MLRSIRPKRTTAKPVFETGPRRRPIPLELVRAWDLDTSKKVLSLDDHTKPVWNVAFSPDGRSP
jgi:WD40 repeat protein